MREDLFFVVVAAIIERSCGQLSCLTQVCFPSSTPCHLRGGWGTPNGKLSREEAPAIGTDKARILAETADWLTYDLPAELIGKVWGGRYRGQRQKWFAMDFLGTDADIDLATEHPEFDRWRWLPAQDLPRMIVPFKRALYEQVLAEFDHLLR